MATLSPQVSPVETRPERPRIESSMSHASTRSHRSSLSREEKKLDLTETTRDKRRLEGKANPMKALQENQPMADAQVEATVENIRALRHKDGEGNFIADPDRSNPTRPRMERPLDTIRKFAEAAEGTNHRRSSYQRPPSAAFIGHDAPAKRNSGYYGPPNGMYSTNGRPGPRAGAGPPGGYYNRNSSYGYQQDSFAEGGPVQRAPPIHQSQHMRNPNAPYTRPDESPNSVDSYHQNYDAMTSGSDEMSKSTNPSSQNSSFDQLHQMGQRKPEGEHNGNPYRQSGGRRNPYPPSAMPHGYGSGYANRSAGPIDDYGFETEPNVLQAPPRQPTMSMSMQQPNGPVEKFYSPPNAQETKRKSWIKRTFSKKA